MRGKFHLVSLFAILAVIVVGFFSTASAERFTGGSYIIDASVVGNSFGGDTTGGSYKLTSSGGESIIGEGSGGSYKLDSGYVAQLQNSLQLTVQPGGLVGYYPLEENSGTFTRDESLYTNNGNLQTGVSWATGKVGNAVDTGGTSDVRVADNAQLNFGQHMTVSLWAKQSALTANKALVAQSQYPTDSSWVLQTGSSSTTLRVFVANAPTDTGGNCVDTDSSWTAGTWHHVAFAYDGTQAASLDRAKVYIDGVARTMSSCGGTISTSLQNSSDYLSIGDFHGLNRQFNGVLDEVKLFNRTLTLNEIKAEYDAGVAGNTAGLGFASGIIPGVSQTSNYDAAVLTDSVKGYTLAVNQNNDLTKGADTISGVSGTIASPVTWVEGTTKGLGFTLYGTNATSIPGKWSSGAAYAAFPGTSTSYYTRTGRQSAKDVLNMRLRLDTTMLNPAGTYTNVITTVGTVTP